MNIQTERLENNVARLTVEIDAERLEKAKQTAARALSGRVTIPGFRKGKAPYRILVNYVGEAAILEEAVESLSNELYRQALKESAIDPYAVGALEDFSLDPKPTFKFTVPLQPEVDLTDYRTVRVPFDAPTVEDADVERAMAQLQEQQAVVEESVTPAQAGNRVTLDIHSHFVDDDEDDDDDDDADDEGDDHDDDEDDSDDDDDAHDHHDQDGEPYIHEHDLVLSLREGDDEPVAPGFTAAMLGVSKDEDREFVLEFPEDEKYEDASGRKVHIHVHVKKVEVVTLPEWSDNLAARITASEETPLTMLELRVRMRENLQKNAEAHARSEYERKALDQMVVMASVSYPEEMVIDQIDSILEDLDRNLRQQGLTLNDFMRITGKSKEDVQKDYRETAVESLKRGLVLREIVKAEQLTVTDEHIEQEIDRMTERFGAQAAQFRSLFARPEMRANIKNDLLQREAFQRIGEIARGEAPELAPAAADRPVDSE